MTPILASITNHVTNATATRSCDDVRKRFANWTLDPTIVENYRKINRVRTVRVFAYDSLRMRLVPRAK